MSFKSTARTKSYRDFNARTFISGGGADSGFTGGVPDNSKPSPQFIELEYLIIGGGGGTSADGSGGGGAGGYLEGTYTITTGIGYDISIGVGGTASVAGSRGIASPGSPSVFFHPTDNIASLGGGRGGAYPSTQPTQQDGGSGGGAGASAGPNAIGSGYFYPGPNQQGFPGGSKGGGQNSSGGGGGGAGGAGQNSPSPPNYVGGNGGNGKASSITGSSVLYAGGGGGGTWSGPGGAAGPGGGGAGGGPTGGTGTPGQTNTGGGAGGSGPSGGQAPSGWGNEGGPGIIILAYPNQYNQLSYIQDGTQYEVLPASARPGYWVYKFKEGIDKTIRW